MPGLCFRLVLIRQLVCGQLLRWRFVCAAGVLAAAIFRDPCMLLSGCAACVFLVYTMSVLMVQGVSNCPGKKSTAGLLLPFLRFRGFNLYARESGFLTQYARKLSCALWFAECFGAR